MSRCSWNSNGEQCKFPGAFSPSLNGGGPWRCFWHRDLGADVASQVAGAQIVTRSQMWDGTPVSYWAMRKQVPADATQTLADAEQRAA